MDTSSTARVDKLDRDVIITGLVVVCGLIMVVLDTTIVNVALETVARQLGAPLSTAQWVVTGYLLAVGLVVPVTGWAMDRFGTKPVWIVSVALFAAGSALCATAWSMDSLIAFRIVQGLGGGMLLPGGQTIITRAAGPQRLGRAMAILGVPMLLGPVFGPVLGGLLVEYTSWHWIFLVNVPVAAVAIGLAVWKLPSGAALTNPGRIDARGLILLSGSLVVLLYGLSQASSHGGFGSWSVLAWLVAGVAGLALYTWHSLGRGPSSLIDVRLFTNRYFASGSVMIFLVAIALFGSLLLLPLYYQAVRGQGALYAGLLLAPQGLGAVVAMPLAGRLTDRVGAGYVVPVGLVLALLGTAPLTHVGPATSYAWLGGALFVRGMGLGAVMMPTFAAAYAGLEKRAVSRAAPTLTAIQQIGASLGSALLVTALTQQLTHLLAGRGIPATGTGASQIVSLPPEARGTVGPILAEAFGFAFWIAFGMTAALIIPALLLPRHATRAPTPDAALRGT
ncbi:MDR family MFS transporter [Amycolatopsis pithecellobii]|uniref:DHA2 family efflux MFS transporter permease subunit n=1 Tax=Amycolatopsis pithecellobii TaxID=664692 RepID=A0A6N7Z390_9PSEU|nr:MDR family MFS transporter [Amycolatopsis pithecellobii]MTD54550.1 DHA2 family efflux MFS transporter permease subunit [Amycolatopsis pithecellobii]